MVGTAELNHAVLVLPEVVKIIPLDQLVTELRERHARFQTLFDAVFRGHVVDGDVFANVADEIEEAEILEPVGVVDHTCGVGSVEVQELLELGFLTGEVVLNALHIEQLALGGLAAGVAHHARRSSNQCNGVVAAPLPMHQHHHRDEVADVQGICRGVKSNVACRIALGKELFQPGRHVVQHAAPLQFTDKIHRRQR